jgi:hypothetical protein
MYYNYPLLFRKVDEWLKRCIATVKCDWGMGLPYRTVFKGKEKRAVKNTSSTIRKEDIT